MCAGAIVHVRLARVVYGVGDPKAGAAGGALNLLQFPSFNHHCEITRGVREADCKSLLQSFFMEQREKRKAEAGSRNSESGGQHSENGNLNSDL